jgi:hypothetical protein
MKRPHATRLSVTRKTLNDLDPDELLMITPAACRHWLHQRQRVVPLAQVFAA